MVEDDSGDGFLFGKPKVKDKLDQRLTTIKKKRKDWYVVVSKRRSYWVAKMVAEVQTKADNGLACNLEWRFWWFWS